MSVVETVREVIVGKIIGRLEEVIFFGLRAKNNLLKLYTLGCIIWAMFLVAVLLIPTEGYLLIEDLILGFFVFLLFGMPPIIPIYYFERKSNEPKKTIITPILMRIVVRVEQILRFGLHSKNNLIKIYTIGFLIWAIGWLIESMFTEGWFFIGNLIFYIILVIPPFIPLYLLERKQKAPLTPLPPTEIPDVSVSKPSEDPEPEPKTPSDFSNQPTTPSTFPMELKPMYTDIEYIGKGGFARVFKAKRVSDGEVVAIKIPISLDEATGKSFLKEIKAWERLNHQNIVGLYDMNIMPIPYFEMEYVENDSLEEIKKPIDIDKAKKIVFDIAEGLKYAHCGGIIHRDLKPQNILLTEELFPKITDWGLSKVLAESKTSSIVGFSPVYAAPEQISPKQFGKTDERTDIWQLGVIFYELVSGKLPFSGESISEISSDIINEDPIPPSELNPEAYEVEGVILRCLSKKKEDRFEDINELFEKLKLCDDQKKSLVEPLKETLIEHKKTLKESTSSEKIEKSKRMIVETLGRLAEIYAKSGDKVELLNTLEDFKYYTIKNTKNLSKVIKHLEYLIKSDGWVSDQFISEIKNLVHRIRREYEI